MRYRNLNTGDTYPALGEPALTERDGRLDGLDNWVRLDGDDQGGTDCPTCGRSTFTPGADGILSQPGMRPTSAFAEVPVVQVDAQGEVVAPDDAKPAKRTSR